MSTSPQFASVNGVQIAYDRLGQGFPILLIHGFPRDRRLWRKVAPALSERFDTVALDRRGYGESDRPLDPDGFTNASMTADVLELTRQLGWERFLVVAHDLGMPVGQRLAADHPDRVAGAVLLDSLPQGAGRADRRDPTGRSWYMDFHKQRGVAEQLIGQNPRLYFSLFLARNQHLSPEEHEMFLEPFCRPGSVEAVLADYRHMLEDDEARWAEWFKDGNTITTPLLILWAGRGPSANAPVLETWRRVAQDVRGEMIPDTAHYIQEEQPQAVIEQIQRFADELVIP
ncbi:MAG: alpha/beta fold hydrolase [Chloroflexota bacterium]